MIHPKEWIAERRATERANRVLEVLISHAPNGMYLEHIRPLIPKMSEIQILEAANRLVTNGQVRAQTHTNKQVLGRERVLFTLGQCGSLPV